LSGLAGGRVSRRSGWRREDQDECGKIPECFMCVHRREREKTGSGTSEMASQEPFSFPHIPHFVFRRSTGFPPLTCCSFPQCSQDISWWGRETNTGNVLRYNSHRIPCLTLSASLSFSTAYKDRHV